MTTHLPPPQAPGRERELFLASLDLAPGEPRRRYLTEACGPDESLRQAVESLLGHDQADGFLERPAVAVTRPAPLPLIAGPAPGSVIGPYRLLAELGMGGCGIVFEAEQETPVRRRVALKVIKPGMDSRAVIARFEAERQTLALLEHPHIARVLDAGTTPTGQPYFVMELVHGAPITHFCDGRQLGLPERLQLFLRVASAVEHAHQRGIIHRDLKPSNILVSGHDGEAWPRIIDFGIAKAVGLRLTGHSTFTVPGQFIGTPAYMSPEQADLKPGAIDGRTDIYSLGALLYEMLTGVPPFDPQTLLTGGLEAMRKTIREQDPVRPSVCVRRQDGPAGQSAGRWGKEPANRHAGRLARDLDWIVLKALEKDRERRYDSVAALALDVRRMLAHEPVSARPPAPLYRLRKHIRRNRLAFATVGAFLVPLCVGLGLNWWQATEKEAALEQVAFAQREQQLQQERAHRALEDETRLRQEAGSLEIAARRQAYASELNLAQQSLAANNLGRATELLDRQRPGGGQSDLRGWEWRYLWQQSRSEALFTLGQATNVITALAVSADGRSLAVAEDNDTVSLWRTDERREVGRWPAGRNRGSMALSPDGAWLAYPIGPGGGPGGRPRPRPGEFGVALRDLATGLNAPLLALDAPVLGFAFSSDARQLLTATTEGSLERWDLASRQRETRQSLEPARGFGPTFAASPDLQWVAYVTRDERVAVFATATGRRHWQSPAPVREVWGLRISPDNGQLVATAGPRGPAVLRRWALATGEELPPLAGHTAWVTDAAFSHDGSRLATTSADQTLRLWDTATGELRRTLRGHRREVWSLAWSGDDRRLFSGSKDGTINVWDPSPAPANAAVSVPENVRSWSFTADSRAVITLDPAGRVRRWEGFGTNAPADLLELGPGRFGGVFSPGGRLLAAGSRDGDIRVWNLDSRRQLCLIGSDSTFRVPVGLPPGSGNLITLQPRERIYARWNLVDGHLIESWPAEAGLRGFSSTATGEFESATDPTFFSVTADGRAELRQWGSGRSRHFELGLRQINGAALAPDGSRFAVSSSQGRAALWQIDPPQQLAEFGGFLLGTHGVSFSPDGGRIAVASLGREAVKLFDPVTAQELLTLAAGDQMVSTVRFSADGRWLGASGPDGTLKLWQAPTADEIAAAENASR